MTDLSVIDSDLGTRKIKTTPLADGSLLIHVLASDSTGDGISDTNPLPVIQNTLKFYDTGNSSEEELGNGGVFEGDWIDTSAYIQAIIDIVTDEASATDGLRFEYSTDGSTVDHAHTFSPLANDPDGHHYATTLDSQYFRVKYTNGTTPQASFKLSTTLFQSASEEGHVHPVSYVINDDHQASIVRAVLVAKRADGDYANIDSTNGDNLKISIEEYDDAVNPVRSDIEGTGYVAVGVTEVAVVFTGTPTHSVIISADPLNAGILYIGKTGVLADGSNAIAFLQAGESLEIDYNDATNALYVISDTAAQQFMAGASL